MRKKITQTYYTYTLCAMWKYNVCMSNKNIGCEQLSLSLSLALSQKLIA